MKENIQEFLWVVRRGMMQWERITKAHHTSWGGAAVLVTSAMPTLLLPLYCLYSQGELAIFNHLAADAFYYFTIARHSVTGWYSYDGQLPVNSFHPLWGWLLTAVFGIVGRSDQATQLVVVFLLNVSFVTVGCAMASLAVYRMTRSVLLGVLLFPGLYGLLLSCCSNDHSAFWLFVPPWSFINGMEGLSILFGGILVYAGTVWYERSGSLSTRFLTLLGVLIALLVLSRLDDVFLVPAFSGTLLFARVGSFRQKARAAGLLSLPTLILLVPYLLFNYWTVGAAMPLSGTDKAGFALVSNLEWALSTLIPGGIELLSFNSDADVGRHITEWPLRSWRIFQMIVPALLAGLFLTVFITGNHTDDGERGCTFLHISLLSYVILKAAYNFAAVEVMHQGWWYYPLSIMVVNVIALQVL
ncbi:MAG: hypothetical protein V1792_02230, partial [Pseudomonadota bacterium]